MKEPDLELVKKRIWKRLEPKLLDRGLHTDALALLRSSQTSVRVSRLKRVQSKERLLDLLPERTPVPVTSFFPTRWWSLGTLGVLVSTLFVPLMNFAPTASALAENRLEVVEGEVYVNGVLVHTEAIIQKGDTIRTEEGAMAHLIFLDDSRMTLGPASTVDIVDSWIDPTNEANTRVIVQQTAGQIWTQVLNLVSKESSFAVRFPQGEIFATQRSSFNVEVTEEESRVEVARNLVDIEVLLPDESYVGVLGQDAVLTVSNEVITDVIEESEKNEVWWTFNLAYGKTYARTLDEQYQNEQISLALILPGNPLYGLKTFREDLQVSLAFTDEAKQDLLIQQAETRLSEAQILLARGETVKATEVLEDYQAAVLQASENGENDTSALLAQYDETQKQVFADSSSTEAETLLQEHLSDASKLLFTDLLEQSEMLSQVASQQLQQIPDLVAEGNYEEALLLLEAYQDSSLSLLADLEEVDMEQREELVSALLEQKVADIQLLRVIATLPEFSDAVDLNSTVLQQLSMFALSLREKEMGDLTAFFEANVYEDAVQEDLYERIKEEAPMTEDLAEQFTTIEQQISAPVDEVLIELETTPTEDPRFSIPHSDQAEDEAKSGE